MSGLPRHKVGIIACSGEEIPEGTVTRLAVRQVLESLRPRHTVTICLPLFLAGGEGDRAFARFHPTIAVDGCRKRWAARGTAMYSGKPAASIVVGDSLPAGGAELGTARRLREAGKQAASHLAARIGLEVDQLLGLKRKAGSGAPLEGPADEEAPERPTAACSCGAAVPVQTLQDEGRAVTLVALPPLFAQFREEGTPPDDSSATELMQAVKIYNPLPEAEEAACAQAVMRAYAAFCREGH